MLLVISVSIAAFIVLLGVLFRMGKGLSLVAGYNTMSKAEKEKIDQKKLARYMSNFMFILAALFLLIASGPIFHIMALYWIGMAAFLLAVFIGAIYLNTGNRITKK